MDVSKPWLTPDQTEPEELAAAIIESWRATGDEPAIARRLHLPLSDVQHVIRTGQFPAKQQTLVFKWN